MDEMKLRILEDLDRVQGGELTVLRLAQRLGYDGWGSIKPMLDDGFGEALSELRRDGVVDCRPNPHLGLEYWRA